MLQKEKNAVRPTAPHLDIYRWPITMLISILHRITGGALYFGTFFLAIWLASLAYSPECFAFLQMLYTSLIGKIIAFFYCLALMQHLASGLRHIICEHYTHLLGKEVSDKIAYMTFAFSIGATIIIWLIGYFY